MVTDSVGFYRGVSQQGGYNKPLVFALICFEIYTLLNGLSWLFLSTLFSGIFAEGAESTVRLPGVDVTSLGTVARGSAGGSYSTPMAVVRRDVYTGRTCSG